MVRWKATVWYRTDKGLYGVDYPLEELRDIHERVENGPHWDTVDKIEISRVNHVDSKTLTVEQAQEL